MKELRRYIRDIPNFPKKGILFRDITPILNEGRIFKEAVNVLLKEIKDLKPDYLVCPESRGFIFGGVLAYKLNCGLVPVRKKGKLPYKTYKVSYTLEYGKETFEIHQDAIKKNSKVVIFDDLLATGGTALALIKLCKKFDAQVLAVLFLIELTFLQGRKKLKDYRIHSIIKF